MPSRQEIIEKATIAARNDWVRYTRKHELEIYKIFDDTAKEIAAQINRRAVQGRVPIPRLQGLLDQVTEEMAAMRPRLTGKIKTGMRNSIDYGIKSGIRGMEKVLPKNLRLGIGSSFISKEGKIIRFDAKVETYASSVWGKVNANAMEALLRFSPSGDTLSSRVWDLVHASEKTIRNRISMGVLQGESAARLSRDIRGYLVQPETLRGIVKRDFHPGTGVYKSAYKNAMRVTRTELGNAYVEGTYRYATHKTWIKGYIFRTASGNPCPICSDLDGTFYPKETPPAITVHPHCFCYPEIVIDEEVVQEF